VAADIVQSAALSETLSESVLFFACDVSSFEQQVELFEFAKSRFSSIDAVIGNAGISDTATVSNYLFKPTGEGKPEKPSTKTLDVNLIGAAYTAHIAIHYFKAQRRSNAASDVGSYSVTLTASSAGLYPFPFGPQYAAAKSGVVGLTRSLGPNLVGHGIRLNCVCPVVVQTGLASAETFQKFALTPMATAVHAYEQSVQDESLYGAVLEASSLNVTRRQNLDFIDQDTAKNFEVFGKLAESMWAA